MLLRSVYFIQYFVFKIYFIIGPVLRNLSKEVFIISTLAFQYSGCDS